MFIYVMFGCGAICRVQGEQGSMLIYVCMCNTVIGVQRSYKVLSVFPGLIKRCGAGASEE